MSRPTPLLLLILAGLILTFVSTSDAVGRKRPKKSLLLVVHQQTDLLGSTQAFGSRPLPPSQVRSDTVILGTGREDFGEPARAGWRVVTLEKNRRDGWVSAEDVTPFEARAKQLKAKAISIRAIAPDGDNKPTLPELIVLQPNPAIQQAWQDVASAITENEALPEADRFPDPYFARAEIWAKAGNYSDSLQDYLTGIEYARRANRDLLSYSMYFDKLANVAKGLQNVPVAAKGSEPEYFFAARRHYNRGYNKFFGGDFRAARARFDDAVRLSPDEPLYWYLRAVTHRRLGDDQRAQHDALMGAYFERYTPLGNHALIRLQGETRIWLEAFRLGSPSHRLMVAK